MRLKINLIILLFFLTACNNLDFLYKNDIKIKNPLYQKTAFILSGVNIPSFYSQALKYLVSVEIKEYELTVSINEEKIKRAVQSNQAISKLDHKLTFEYVLLNVEKKCVVFKREIASRFTFEPRSSGYNFGSDESLNDLYKTAVEINLQQFIDKVLNEDLTVCINEG